jgi:hypothetical protein
LLLFHQLHMGFMGTMCLFSRLAHYLFSSLVTLPRGYPND